MQSVRGFSARQWRAASLSASACCRCFTSWTFSHGLRELHDTVRLMSGCEQQIYRCFSFSSTNFVNGRTENRLSKCISCYRSHLNCWRCLEKDILDKRGNFTLIPRAQCYRSFSNSLNKDRETLHTSRFHSKLYRPLSDKRGQCSQCIFHHTSTTAHTANNAQSKSGDSDTESGGEKMDPSLELLTSSPTASALKTLNVVPGKGPPPEPPVNCCMSGCANCVWIMYAEELKNYYNDGGQAAVNAIEQIENPSLKAFLKLELDL